MNCDKCKLYNWYYDWCNKWECTVDGREVHSCFTPYRKYKEGEPTEFDKLLESYDPIDAEYRHRFLCNESNNENSVLKHNKSFIPSKEELERIFFFVL